MVTTGFTYQINNMRLITFASRWKRELQPEIVKAGKNIAKKYSKIKEIEDDNKYFAESQKRQNEISGLRDKTLANRFQPGRKIVKPHIFDDRLNDVTREQNRIRGDNGKVSISDNGRGKLEQLKARRNSTNQNIKFLGKAKKFISKNKLGLGVAGVVSLGAVGYGVAKKIRSDKGKKRGKYFK